MSESLPSEPIIVHDVPEVDDFKTEFVYTFFTADESVVNPGGGSASTSLEPNETNLSQSRIPRHVRLTWKPVSVRVNLQSEYHRNNVLLYKDLLKNNLGSIISEDFYTKGFRSILFNDQQIVDKMIGYVSSSKALDDVVGLYPKKNNDVSVDSLKSNSPSNVAIDLMSKLPEEIDPKLIYVAAKPAKIEFLDGGKEEFGLDSRIYVRLNSAIANSLLYSGSYSTFSTYDAKPLIASSDDEAQMYSTLADVDIPYVYTSAKEIVSLPEPIIMGYIIDKYDITLDNPIKVERFVFEGANINSCIDTNISYGRRYDYRISAVALITTSDFDRYSTGVITGKVADYLIRSKDTSSIVDTVEAVPPPPPADLNFIWDYELDKLYLNWTFPANPQRDIKKFQVFRRSSTNEPFELLKIIDFDDSQIKWSDLEQLPLTAPPGIVSKVNSPVTYYVDDDFKRPNLTKVDRLTVSKYIYTVCSVDAHGYSSNYGPQFEVSFDAFKNKLTKRLVSHAGAPKCYPNMYLEADAFIDTIRVGGQGSRRLKLYFMPEYYEVRYSDGTREKTVSTTQDGGGYKLQFINLDMQEMSTINVEVDDRRR